MRNLCTVLFCCESKTALKRSLSENESKSKSNIQLDTSVLYKTILEEWRNEFVEKKKKTSGRTVRMPKHGANKGFCKNSAYSFQQLSLMSFNLQYEL